ncbi:hypothetical protein Tco_0889417 [Tanacetum coccineum]
MLREFPSSKLTGAKQESRRPKQDCIHKLCTSQQTGTCGRTEGEVHKRKGNPRRSRRRRQHMDDTHMCVTLYKDYLPAEIKRKPWGTSTKATSMHSGPRSVVAKAIRTGYYWPTMHMDARKFNRESNDCHVHRPSQENPQQQFNSYTSPWPCLQNGDRHSRTFPGRIQAKSKF